MLLTRIYLCNSLYTVVNLFVTFLVFRLCILSIFILMIDYVKSETCQVLKILSFLLRLYEFCAYIIRS